MGRPALLSATCDVRPSATDGVSATRATSAFRWPADYALDSLQRSDGAEDRLGGR